MSTSFETIRKCHKCQNNMQIKITKNDKQKNPLDDKITTFICEGCQHEVNILTKSSLLTNILSALFVGGFTLYFLFTGLADFILYSLASGTVEAIMGIALSAFALLFVIGPALMLINAYLNIKKRSNYTLARSQTNIFKQNEIYYNLFLGALPIVFVLLLGMIDFYWYEINEILVMFLLPIVFSPIIFANKLKSSIVNVFYGTLFWFALGIVGFYLFK